MIIDELLAFVRESVKSKRTSANARLLWRVMERAIENGKAGRLGFRFRNTATLTVTAKNAFGIPSTHTFNIAVD